MTPRALGYRQDPPDTRDFSAAEKLGVAPSPPSASNRHLIVDVLDQLNLSACVANAIMQAMRASHVHQGVANPKLGSRLFAYYASRAFHHETNVDAGTHLRTCFQSLNKFGFCPEDAFPYTDQGEPWRKLPPTAAFRAAYDQISPTDYRRIFTVGSARVDDIKRAVAAGYVVCFGTDVAQDFFGDDGKTPILPPVGKQIAGGHAMAVVGYDGDVFTICNSWSSGWGDGGFCLFSADYLAWDGTRDLWLVEHAPKYSE